MKKYSEIAKNHRNEIIEAIKALEKSDPQVQTDLYLYPDGTTEEFINVGGNSWLDNEHKVVYHTDHSTWDDEAMDNMTDWDIENEADEIVDFFIKKMEEEESAEEEEW